jgi:hypothetical protein
MNDGLWDDAYYLRLQLQHRLRRLAADLGERLPREDRRLVEELIDANECGLALATIVDAVAEEGLSVEPVIADEIARLRDAMGMAEPLAMQPETTVR